MNPGPSPTDGGHVAKDEALVRNRSAGLPWGPVAVLFLIYCAGASGRNGGVDASIVLAQSRAFLDGRISLHPGAVGGLGAEGLDGLRYSHFGIGCSLLWTPFILVGRLLGSVFGRVSLEQWEDFVVSFSPAFVSCGTLLLLARAWLDAGASAARVRAGIWLFGFASMLWPYSKLLGSDLVMALLILAGVVVARRTTALRGAAWAGLFWGLAFLTRKQLVSITPALFGWIAWLGWERSRAAGRTAGFRSAAVHLGAATSTYLVAVALKLGWNKARFGGWWVEPYPGSEGWVLPSVSEYLARIAGQLFDTGRGQVWFNAILVAVLLVAGRRWWRHGRDTMLLFLACSTGTVAFFGLFEYWHGGISFGPRLQLLILPLGAVGWAHLPPKLGPARRAVLGIGAAMSLVAVTPGVFVDPLCIDKHHEWLWNRRGPMFLAGWAEMRAVFGHGRPRLPEGLRASAYTLETHAPFQRPDLWWLHAVAVARERNGTAEPGSTGR